MDQKIDYNTLMSYYIVRESTHRKSITLLPTPKRARYYRGVCRPPISTVHSARRLYVLLYTCCNTLYVLVCICDREGRENNNTSRMQHPVIGTYVYNV